MVTYQRLILYKGSIVNSGADEMDKEISCRAKQLSGYINYCPRMVKNRMCADHGRYIVIHYGIWLQQPIVYPSFIFWLGGKRVTTTTVAIKREPVMIVRSLDKKGILLHLSFAYSFWAFSITFISFSPKSDYPFFWLCNNQHRCIQKWASLNKHDDFPTTMVSNGVHNSAHYVVSSQKQPLDPFNDSTWSLDIKNKLHNREKRTFYYSILFAFLAQ